MTSESRCLDALREAAERLGESPTKAQYEELDLTPASSTILRVVVGWNEAKERAGLEIYTQEEGGGIPVQPRPEGVEIPADREWAELTPQQRWYYKNRGRRIDRKEVRRRRLQQWLTEYKREYCTCERCGETHPACLDFHHIDEKAMDVSRMANHGYSKQRIREEMEVCIVLCASCHRKRHYSSEAVVEVSPSESSREGTDTDDRAAERRRLRVWLDTYKRESDGCTRCDESDPGSLDFHHVGPKTMGIAQMISRRCPEDRIREELEKCELLCANCHRKEHHDG